MLETYLLYKKFIAGEGGGEGSAGIPKNSKLIKVFGESMNNIATFLKEPTPLEWIKNALDQIPLLLVDHAHCEKKAASTAIGLIYRYCDQTVLLQKMAKLAREELRHFEQVLAMIHKRKERFHHLPPGSYATKLHQHITAHEPCKLIDTLIVGAYIEARSCERFSLLAQHLEDELASFYKKLYLAEARHFEEYLSLAIHYSDQDISDRIDFFGKIEAQIILTMDTCFRFHSGLPPCSSNSMSSTPSEIKSPVL